MSAKLDIEWKADALEQEAVEVTLVRQIAPPKPELRCPECNALLYSRRHRHCSVCGEDLPQEILFSSLEAARVTELLNAERRRHRAWMRKRG